MTPEEEKKLRDEALASLLRMQNFDAEKLSQEAEFGSAYDFRDAITPANRLINLFKQVDPQALDSLETDQLEKLKNIANDCYGYFYRILNFTTLSNHNRASMVDDITNSYQLIFNALYPMISDSLYKSVKDKTNETIQFLEQKKQEADNVLEVVRNIAAKQVVNQQSIYFKEEADKNEKKAEYWIIATIWAVLLLLFYAFSSLFLHKIPWINIENLYELVQVSISKILIFVVLSYVFYFSAKNYLSNKHNATVNRHRQNALQTYQALVEAAGDTQYKDVILVHAASCIYAPQPTGYTGSNAEAPGAKSVIELLSKSATEK